MTPDERFEVVLDKFREAIRTAKWHAPALTAVVDRCAATMRDRQAGFGIDLTDRAQRHAFIAGLGMALEGISTSAPLVPDVWNELGIRMRALVQMEDLRQEGSIR